MVKTTNRNVIPKNRDAQGAAVAEISGRYKMIPVDMETHKNFIEVCKARGFGRRGQGAMVRMLVRQEMEKLEKEKE